MKCRHIFLFVFLIRSISPALAQDEQVDFQRMQDLQYLDLGIQHYENGQYEEADKLFRQVLEAVKVLPAEICYYFGANSYHLGKYKQSINWLNKYIELKGTSGRYFQECTQYLEKAENEYRQASASNRKSQDVYDPGQEVDYTVMPKVDCGPSGLVVCPVCKGQTVIIKRSALGTVYRPCPWCDEHGNLTCDEYNLLLLGQLKPRSEREKNKKADEAGAGH